MVTIRRERGEKEREKGLSNGSSPFKLFGSLKVTSA